MKCFVKKSEASARNWIEDNWDLLRRISQNRIIRPVTKGLDPKMHFHFHPQPGEIIQFDEHSLQMGWFNHQPEIHMLNNFPTFNFIEWIVEFQASIFFQNMDLKKKPAVQQPTKNVQLKQHFDHFYFDQTSKLRYVDVQLVCWYSQLPSLHSQSTLGCYSETEPPGYMVTKKVGLARKSELPKCREDFKF